MIIYFGLMAMQVIVRKWDKQEERLVRVPEEEVYVCLGFINISIHVIIIDAIVMKDGCLNFNLHSASQLRSL